MPEPTPWSPVATTTSSDAGKAIEAMEWTDEDGNTHLMPAVIDEKGQKVPFVPAQVKASLTTANTEARDRRLLLTSLIEAAGIETSGTANDRHDRLLSAVKELPTLREDLKKARENQGEDDGDFDTRVAEAAKGRVDAANAKVSERDTELKARDAKITSLQEQLNRQEVNEGLRAFHRGQSELFADNSEGMFLSVMNGEHDGYTLRSTGKRGPDGTPRLAFYDTNGDARTQPGSGLNYSLLDHMQDKAFRSQYGLLFRPKGGSGDHELGGSDDTNPDEMSQAELDAALDKELDAM